MLPPLIRSRRRVREKGGSLGAWLAWCSTTEVDDACAGLASALSPPAGAWSTSLRGREERKGGGEREERDGGCGSEGGWLGLK